jgi:hypothetical protein
MPIIAIVDPSGGTGGGTFGDLPQDDFKVIRITVRSGLFVDAIQMTHERPDGTLFNFPHHGGFGGFEKTLDLDVHLGDHITSIAGRSGSSVDHLEIRTSRGLLLKAGSSGGGVDYLYEAPPGFEIAGFHGRAGDLIDAIGVILRRL